MTPKFSIIIPTFNEERAIEKTLQSLKELQGIEYEIIVADSGSTDQTAAIALRYADRVVAYDDPPKNASRGRNLGASVARGEYLVFIDADVIVEDINTFFKVALAEFTQDSKLVGLVPRIKVFPEVCKWSDTVSYAIVNRFFYVTNNIFGGGAGSGELQMIRANVFGNLGGYNEDLYIGEDNELFDRLSKVGRTKLIWSLAVAHPSRRAHAIGWHKLWSEWMFNGISVKIWGKPWSSEWLHIR